MAEALPAVLCSQRWALPMGGPRVAGPQVSPNLPTHSGRGAFLHTYQGRQGPKVSLLEVPPGPGAHQDAM